MIEENRSGSRLRKREKGFNEPVVSGMLTVVNKAVRGMVKKRFSIRRLVLALTLATWCPGWGAVYYVATNGSNAANGLSTSTPWRTVGYAVNRASGGDTVYVRGGEYREFVNCTNTRGSASAWITVQAYSNEIPVVKGSDVVTGWVQHSSTIWKKTNWTVNVQQVFVDGRLLQQIGWPNDYVSTNAFSCNMIDYICIPYGHCCTEINKKAVPFIAINGLAEMISHSFFYDSRSSTLFIKLNEGDDPGNRLVEVSSRYGLFYMGDTTRYIRLVGLHFRHNNSFSQTLFGWPGIVIGNSCIAEDCDIQWCDAYGVYFKNNSKILRCRVSNNGMDGMRPSSVTNINITSCVVIYNNYRKISANYVGGIKVHPNSDGMIQSNEVAWNRCIGVWIDECKSGNRITIRNNSIHHNRQVIPCSAVGDWGAAGIFVEKSSNADVYGNLIYSNAIYGVELSGVSGVRLYNNTIVGTYRPKGLAPEALSAALNIYTHAPTQPVANNRIYNNVFAYNNTEFDIYTIPQDGVTMYGNLIDYNCYYRHPNAYTASPPCRWTSGSGFVEPRASFCNALTQRTSWTNLASWTFKTGYDSNSIAVDPLLHPAFRLTSNSPCVDRGVVSAFMTLTQDQDGTPRNQGSRIDMGAFELGPFLCDFNQNTWTGLYPLTVTFTGSGIGTNADTVWYGWDFDGNGELEMQGPDLSRVTNTYPSAGDYAVGLYVSNSTGEAAQNIKPSAVQALVQYPPKPFSLNAVALTNSVTLRWSSPVLTGISNSSVAIRYSTEAYPASLSDGLFLTTTTNRCFTHTNLSSGASYYYTIWVTHDGVGYVDP